MAKHYNLYYLFLADQQENSMDLAAKEKIKKNIEKFYREIKPPWESNPLSSIEDEVPKEKWEGENNEKEDSLDPGPGRHPGIDDSHSDHSKKEKIKNFSKM